MLTQPPNLAPGEAQPSAPDPCTHAESNSTTQDEVLFALTAGPGWAAAWLEQVQKVQSSALTIPSTRMIHSPSRSDASAHR